MDGGFGALAGKPYAAAIAALEQKDSKTPDRATGGTIARAIRTLVRPGEFQSGMPISDVLRLTLPQLTILVSSPSSPGVRKVVSPQEAKARAAADFKRNPEEYRRLIKEAEERAKRSLVG